MGTKAHIFGGRERYVSCGYIDSSFGGFTTSRARREGARRPRHPAPGREGWLWVPQGQVGAGREAHPGAPWRGNVTRRLKSGHVSRANTRNTLISFCDYMYTDISYTLLCLISLHNLMHVKATSPGVSHTPMTMTVVFSHSPFRFSLRFF